MTWWPRRGGRLAGAAVVRGGAGSPAPWHASGMSAPAEWITVLGYENLPKAPRLSQAMGA
jgi:hypothetical protein